MGGTTWTARRALLWRGLWRHLDADAPFAAVHDRCRACFLVERYAARGVVAQKVAAHRRFSVVDRAIATDGWKIVGLLRLCPVPFGISNYLYGLTGIDFWRKLARNAALLRRLPLPRRFREADGRGRDYPVQYALGALTVIALIGFTWMLGRIARRTAGAHLEEANATP
ncbi:MAG: VTT domain-containing protein [Verrucomicrobiota bacterium]|nr:VTT domain-containing protein [Verrucomicrobiota bacterium]